MPGFELSQAVLSRQPNDELLASQSRIVYDHEFIEEYFQYSRKQKQSYLANLTSVEPYKRIASLSFILSNEDDPYVYESALGVLNETALEDPYSSLSLIEIAIESYEDIPALAITALNAPAIYLPDRVTNIVENVLDRSKNVSSKITEVACNVALSSSNNGLYLFSRLKEIDSLDFYVKQSFMELVTIKPEYFGLVETSPDISLDNSDIQEWTYNLNEHLAVYRPVELPHTVMYLEAQQKGIGINLLKKHCKVDDSLTDEDKDLSNYYATDLDTVDVSPVGRFISSREFLEFNNLEVKNNILEQIIDDHKLKDLLIKDINSLNINLNELNSHQLSAWRNITNDMPKLKELVDDMHPPIRESITEDSPVYIEYKNKQREYIQDPKIFGMELINDIDYYPIKFIRSKLIENRDDLFEILYKHPNDVIKVLLIKEMTECGVNPSCLDLADISNKTLNSYAKWLKYHVEKEKEYYSQILEETPKWEKSFIERVGRYNLGTTLTKRLSDTRLTVYDYLHSMPEYSKGKIHLGNYDVECLYIKLKTDNLESFLNTKGESISKLEAVFDHEMLHAISARGLAIRSFNFKRPPVVSHEQLGLMFYDRSADNSLIKTRHRWLNEALTESINKDILNLSEEHAMYPKERELYDLLRVCGLFKIPRSAFIDAYFEAHEDIEKTQAKTKLNRLVWLLKSAYGSNILKVIDDKVEGYGQTDKASDFLLAKSEEINSTN